MIVVGEAGDGTELAERVRGRADVVVMDVAMPNVAGPEVTRELRSRAASVKVLALSAHEDRVAAEQMLAAGAAGYVVKRSACEDLLRAIRCIAKGETYIDPAIAGALVTAFVRTPAPGAEPDGSPLSDREAEVLRLPPPRPRPPGVAA